LLAIRAAGPNLRFGGHPRTRAMFTFLFIGSLIAGVAIAWVGWFGQRDHNSERGPKEK